jgi:hypothetical protein
VSAGRHAHLAGPRAPQLAWDYAREEQEDDKEARVLQTYGSLTILHELQ